jgi:hypothetical protein
MVDLDEEAAAEDHVQGRGRPAAPREAVAEDLVETAAIQFRVVAGHGGRRQRRTSSRIRQWRNSFGMQRWTSSRRQQRWFSSRRQLFDGGGGAGCERALGEREGGK